MSTYASGCRPSLLSSLSQSCAHPDTHSIACLRRHCNGHALYAAAASSLQGRSCRLQTVTMLPCCHGLGDGSRGRTLQSCIASPAGKEGEVLQYTGNLRGNMALQLACSSTRAVLLAARGVHACARLQRGSRARCLISHTYTAPSSDHACATKECAESAHLLAGCCCRCVTGGRRLL